MDVDAISLAAGVLAGNRRAIARAISWVERQDAQSSRLLAALYPHTGRAHIVGITGPPGTGKSTLVCQVALAYRKRGVSVGVIAVDPSSPFSGGALLGDRIRMRDLVGDTGVFVRSMATRGALGGLSGATTEAVQILDAARYALILVETVGAGQDEVEIARTAHTTVVVEAPGLGDDIQAIKAGLIEIADLFCVNKADRQDADATAHTLELMLATLPQPAEPDSDEWHIPVQKTVALDGTGVAELVALIDAHRTYLHDSGRWQAKELERAQSHLEALLRQALLDRFLARFDALEWASTASQVAERRMSPREAVQKLLTTGSE